MKIAIGLGLDKNGKKAAEQIVKQTLKTVPKPGLAIAFSSVSLYQAKVHKALCRYLDPAILTRGSCYAEITNAGVSRGSVGAADRREYTFIGDAVNTAQCLGEQLRAGKVLVSEAVYRDAPGVFSAAAERTVPLKGKAKPMAAYLCEP